MIETIKKNWDFAINILFAFLLWYVSFKKPDNGENLIKYIFYVSLFLIVFKIILFWDNYNKKKTKKIIKIFLNENNKSIESNRVTIYLKKLGIQFIFSYLFFSFIWYYKEHKRNKILLIHLKRIPNPFKKYLVQKIRYGVPFENGSTTYFKVAEQKKEVNGIASYAFFKSASEYVTDLPNINKIELNGINIDSNNNNARKVKRYIKKSKIKNIEQLRTMHRYPINIFATPLIINNKKQGVIVFDSIEDKEKLNYEQINLCSRIITEIIS